MMGDIESLKWLTESQVIDISKEYELPLFVYSEELLLKQIDNLLSFPVNEGFGLTVRYAMKANPNRNILSIMNSKGVKIDASSEFEALRAIAVGIKPSDIQLTAQEFPKDIESLVKQGVLFNACSLRQLEEYGKRFPNSSVSLRWNPGIGSGSNFKTDVGGLKSSFGIWHEYIDDVKAILKKYNLKVFLIHSHIGSGNDPEIWKEGAKLTLDIAKHFEECERVSLGGGFKVARMSNEESADLTAIGEELKSIFMEFYKQHNRKMHLELEPGTYLVANAGSILCTVDDIVDTGKDGYEFIKVNTGMDSISRPTIYGSKHPLITINVDKSLDINEIREYVVVGHCCESGDMLTQGLGGVIETRRMKKANIGDIIVIEGAGAYCSGMSVKNYNSFPEIEEIMIMTNSTIRTIRKRQAIEQMIQNELIY